MGYEKGLCTALCEALSTQGNGGLKIKTICYRQVAPYFWQSFFFSKKFSAICCPTFPLYLLCDLALANYWQYHIFLYIIWIFVIIDTLLNTHKVRDFPTQHIFICKYHTIMVLNCVPRKLVPKGFLNRSYSFSDIILLLNRQKFLSRYYRHQVE